MNGLIYQTLEAVRTGLQAVNTNLDVELYDGVFDDEAVDRILTRSGRVHLTFLEANPAMALVGGETVLNASYGAYVATNRSDRLKSGINAVEALAAGLIAMTRQTSFKMPPYTMPVALGAIQNLYSKGVGDRAIALYGMSFAVPIVIGKAVFANDLTTYDPKRFTFSIDEGGAPVPLDPNDRERLA